MHHDPASNRHRTKDARRRLARGGVTRGLMQAGLLAALCCVPWTGTWAAPPNVPDSIAQRVVPCTLCHGRQGRSTPEGYFPRIAGKPAGYLYQQLLNFREGRRLYAPMTQLLEHLDDAYLMEMAQHFAQLDLPYAAPPPNPATPGMLARGQQLVQQGDPGRDIPACARCHGERLTGVQPAVPGLLGLPRDYLNSQLGAWKTGQRHAVAPDCMAQIAQRLGDEDIGAASGWLSLQPVPADSHPAPPDDRPLPIACGSVPR